MCQEKIGACVLISNTFHGGVNDFLNTILGKRMFTVNSYYKKGSGNESYYASNQIIDQCGKRIDHTGIPITEASYKAIIEKNKNEQNE